MQIARAAIAAMAAAILALFWPLAGIAQQAAPPAENPIAAPAAANQIATYVGEQVCARCHQPNNVHFSHTVHAKAFRQNPRNETERRVCEACHGPGSLHAEAPTDHSTLIGYTKSWGTPLKCRTRRASPATRAASACTGRGRPMPAICWVAPIATIPWRASRPTGLLVRATISETCMMCHKQQEAEFRRRSHMPLPEGKMSCADCHNPHGSVTDPLLKADSVNDVCYACHAEKRGPLLWEHAPVRERCTNCHQPHGSNHDNLLVAARPYLCQQCHNSLGTALRPVLPRGSNRGGGASGRNAEPAGHRSRLPELPYAGPWQQPSVGCALFALIIETQGRTYETRCSPSPPFVAMPSLPCAAAAQRQRRRQRTRLRTLALCVCAAWGHLSASSAMADSATGVDTVLGNALNPGRPAGPFALDQDALIASHSPSGRLYGIPYAEIPQRQTENGWLYNGWLEFGGLFGDANESAALFREFKDLRNGPYVNNFALQADKPDAAKYLEAAGGGVGNKDQFYGMQLGRYNDWRVRLFYNETPHVFTSTYRSLWDGVGTGNLSLTPTTPALVPGGGGCRRRPPPTTCAMR